LLSAAQMALADKRTSATAEMITLNFIEFVSYAKKWVTLTALDVM
jgi:hypothetical protein